MAKCKICGKEVNYIQLSKKKKVAVEKKEISIYVTGTQSHVKGHQVHECENK